MVHADTSKLLSREERDQLDRSKKKAKVDGASQDTMGDPVMMEPEVSVA